MRRELTPHRQRAAPASLLYRRASPPTHRTDRADRASPQDLISLIALFRSPSVKNYTGINVPWTSCREARSDGSSVLPDPLWGFTTRGIILDLSRQAQRILTPWGGLTLGYRLSFPGYQDKEVPEPSSDPKAKKPAHNTAWPVTPAGPSSGEDHPLFFELSKFKRSILAMSKMPNRCHFRVSEINGRACPKGEVRVDTLE